MKKFIVYLLVIICTVSLGFAVFYLVRDNEIISISSASMYKDIGDTFTLDVNHVNKKASTSISITSSDDTIVSGKYSEEKGTYTAEAKKGGVARINVRTTNAKFRNLWCDIIVGDGTIESPFYISTAEQLAAIGMGGQYFTTDTEGNRVEVDGVFTGSGDYERYLSNACYKLVADIDASEVNGGYWVPLQHFNGRFDGNGHTISNVYIDVEGYQNSDLSNKSTLFVNNCKAGLFASLGKDSVVYNLKLKNYVATNGANGTGVYSAFGTVAGENAGTIERVEVEDASLAVNSGVFGGIVGINKSNVIREAVTSDDDTDKSQLVEYVARVDRCSIHFDLGHKETADGTTIMNISGMVGGVVGSNLGGTIVYSYAMGDVYMGETKITYGGVVAENSTYRFSESGSDSYVYLGANIKDCYSDLRLIASNVTALNDSTIGGAIGLNQDYQNGVYEDEDNNINDYKVNSYLIGVYYNKDNLNYEQEGFEKNFKGVASFKLDNNAVSFVDTKTIVWGLTNEEMKDGENFVSHTTKTVEFNNDGESKGIVEKNVLWLFDTVWAIDSETNDGKPYLNYQLIYVPDDFATVGTPIVSEDYARYYYKYEVNYPVSIISGVDGKLRIKVEEYYQLKFSPTGINMEWSSSNSEIVTVDEKTGLLHGIKAGVATVTVKTKTNSDTITVIVENIPYTIDNIPETIYMYAGASYNLGKLEDILSPMLIGNDEMSLSIKDKDGNATSLVTINHTSLTKNDANQGIILTAPNADNTGTAKLIIKVADTEVSVNIVVSKMNLTVDQRTISGYYEDMKKDNRLSGSVTISHNTGTDLTYTCVSDNESVVKATISGNKLNYTIKGVGTATVTIKATGYTGSANVYFNIKSETSVDLTLSSATITGYYSDVKKTGSVTISNSAGASLSYEASVIEGANVVSVSMSGNAMKYTIKGVGTATATINITTAHYAGSANVYFNILEDPATGDGGNQTVEFIDLNYASVTIYKGDTLTLKATGKYSSSVTWTSSDSSVATVSGGVVKGIKAGSTTITASSGSVSTSCKVTVKESSYATISVSPTSATISEGSTKQLTARGSGYSKVTWGSSNSSVASVNSNGLVTAIKAGTCKITAYGKDGEGNTKATATCSITVTAVPTTITLSVSPSTTVNKGTDVTIDANVNKSGTVVWGYTFSGASENGNTLSVDTSSLLGTYTVTATIGSTSASASFTVQDPNAYSKYITTYAQLNAMRYHLNREFILAANITVSDTWVPIGTCSAPFTGKFTNNGSYTISGLTTTSGDHAGLFGCIKGASISGINVSGAEFKATTAESKATTYAGGIAGHAKGNATIANCKVTDSNISTTSSTSYAGGIVGKAESSSISGCTSSASISATKGGYAGGIAGKSNSTISSCLVTSTITAPTSSTSYAGGIAGESTYKIETSTIRSSVITGYYSGGIAGSFNRSLTLTISFDTTNKGYRYADLSSASKTVLSSSANVSVTRTAVKDTTTVKGVNVGGLFGVLQSGLVTNCYTRATINGVSSSSYKGGFACDINASGSFKNAGGTGNVGIILYCYASVKFSGSGTNYAITRSTVHNHAVIDTTRSAGYVMEYVFDNGTDGNASYSHGNTWSDNIKAEKSTSEMKTLSTYTGKNFSTTYWNLSSGYPTLKGEK